MTVSGTVRPEEYHVSHVACRIPRLFSARFCFALFCFPHSGMSTRRCVRWAQNTVRALSEEIIACAEHRTQCVHWAKKSSRALSKESIACAEHRTHYVHWAHNSAIVPWAKTNKQKTNKETEKQTTNKQINDKQTNKTLLQRTHYERWAKSSLHALRTQLHHACSEQRTQCVHSATNLQYNTIQYNFIVSV